MSKGHVLDLTKYHFAKRIGDLALYGTWVGADLDDVEPALVLVPAHRNVSFERTVPCCVALSSAYKYDSPAYLLRAAMEFNRTLGREDSMSQVHKVADVIHGHLQDLIEMPPYPTERQGVAAEVVVTDSSGRTQEADIYDFH